MQKLKFKKTHLRKDSLLYIYRYTYTLWVTFAKNVKCGSISKYNSFWTHAESKIQADTSTEREFITHIWRHIQIMCHTWKETHKTCSVDLEVSRHTGKSSQATERQSTQLDNSSGREHSFATATISSFHMTRYYKTPACEQLLHGGPKTTVQYLP